MNRCKFDLHLFFSNMVKLNLIYYKLILISQAIHHQNIIAVLAGIVIGSGVNMFFVTISGSIIPPPEGADVTTREGFGAAIHLLQARHYIMPFLAHALGALAGAFIAALIAVNHQFKFAMGIGVFF